VHREAALPGLCARPSVYARSSRERRRERLDAKFHDVAGDRPLFLSVT
jgi:hypothetical protein